MVSLLCYCKESHYLLSKKIAEKDKCRKLIEMLYFRDYQFCVSRGDNFHAESFSLILSAFSHFCLRVSMD